MNRPDPAPAEVVPTAPARSPFKTPRAAAIAGITFSILLSWSMGLLVSTVQSDPREAGLWLKTSAERVSFALNLVPFAGIAFMWFLGVLRDRLGRQEDQFFATVFLGSGLMFLGMLFVAASAMAALITAYPASSDALLTSGTFAYGRAFTYSVMQIYALKMAAVFMVTSSTLLLRTQLSARGTAYLGYAGAAFLLAGSAYLNWAFFVLPGWVFLVSADILIDNLRRG